METIRSISYLFFLLLEVLCWGAVFSVFIGLLWIGLRNFVNENNDIENK